MMNIWSISEVKEDAKRILRQSYVDGNGKSHLFYWYNFLFSAIMIVATAILSSVLTALIPGGAPIAITIFFVNPLMVAFCLYTLWQRNGIIRIKDALLSPTENENYLCLVAGMGMMTLFIFLWSLLLIIPGIIKTYAYRMVPFLLAENPQLGWKRALDLSQQMTAGEKGSLFFLDLSFIGWMLLCAITGGIGIFFLTPYYQTTQGEVYLRLREKLVCAGMMDEDELHRKSAFIELN